MNFRFLAAILAAGCLVIGVIASLTHGGTMDEVQALGHFLIVAAAIIIAGVLISSAILSKK